MRTFVVCSYCQKYSCFLRSNPCFSLRSQGGTSLCVRCKYLPVWESWFGYLQVCGWAASQLLFPCLWSMILWSPPEGMVFKLICCRSCILSKSNGGFAKEFCSFYDGYGNLCELNIQLLDWDIATQIQLFLARLDLDLQLLIQECIGAIIVFMTLTSDQGRLVSLVSYPSWPCLCLSGTIFRARKPLGSF
jgi:hypothetical protein